MVDLCSVFSLWSNCHGLGGNWLVSHFSKEGHLIPIRQHYVSHVKFFIYLCYLLCVRLYIFAIYKSFLCVICCMIYGPLYLLNIIMLFVSKGYLFKKKYESL